MFWGVSSYTPHIEPSRCRQARPRICRVVLCILFSLFMSPLPAKLASHSWPCACGRSTSCFQVFVRRRHETQWNVQGRRTKLLPLSLTFSSVPHAPQWPPVDKTEQTEDVLHRAECSDIAAPGAGQMLCSQRRGAETRIKILSLQNSAAPQVQEIALELGPAGMYCEEASITPSQSWRGSQEVLERK